MTLTHIVCVNNLFMHFIATHVVSMATPDVMDSHNLSREISPPMESRQVFQNLAKKLHRLESRLGMWIWQMILRL